MYLGPSWGHLGPTSPIMDHFRSSWDHLAPKDGPKYPRYAGVRGGTRGVAGGVAGGRPRLIGVHGGDLEGETGGG